MAGDRRRKHAVYIKSFIRRCGELLEGCPKGLHPTYQHQQHNLEETIADPLELIESMPKGETRDRLFNQISGLDSIADVMRKARRCVVQGERGRGLIQGCHLADRNFG